MIISEISDLIIEDHFANVEPFIYEIRPGKKTYASFWSDIFGLPNYDADYTIIVESFIRDYTTKYNQAFSYSDLTNAEGAFFWDGDNQILYIHFEHNYEGHNAIYQYGTFWGISDIKPAYLDDQQYSPFLKGSPSFSQSQDIVNYDRLNFIAGSMVIANGDMIVRGKRVGVADNLIDANIYGNDVFIYYYPDEKLNEFGNGDRSDLVRLGAFYIEDYDISLNKIVFNLQDKRKAGEVSILTETLDTADYPDIGDNTDTPIPLMYGTVREAPAIALNSETTTGEVDYIVAQLLTSIGAVYADVDDIWTLVTPINIDLASGIFSLSEAEGRDSNGSLRDVKLVSPSGIAISKTSDIIWDLNFRYLAVPFNDSFYNTTEWASEEASLSTGGWLFTESEYLYDAIKTVQNGSLLGFRYEISPDGRRTIRIDDPDRESSGFISNVFFDNRETLPVSTDSDQVYANIKIKYNKSFNSGKFLSSKNSYYANSVLAKFKNISTLTTETMLTTSVDAASRAASDALKFSEIPKIFTGILNDKQFLTVRIFDIYTLEITPGSGDADTETIDGRGYYGYRKGKVVGINPQGATQKNTVLFQLLEE